MALRARCASGIQQNDCAALQDLTYAEPFYNSGQKKRGFKRFPTTPFRLLVEVVTSLPVSIRFEHNVQTNTEAEMMNLYLVATSI